jgi:predicted metal-dependent peptidase
MEDENPPFFKGKIMEEAPKINTEKVSISDEQATEAATKALIAAGFLRPRLTKVRIPRAFEDISTRWASKAPFFSEFMMRFQFFETADIPTAGVSVMRGNLNLYYNDEFIYGGGMRYKTDNQGVPLFILDANGEKIVENGKFKCEMEVRPPLSKPELEGLLLHEIYHLIRLHTVRSLEDHELFNIANDMLINNDITKLQIANRQFKNSRDLKPDEDQYISLPEGGIYLQKALDAGYKGQPVSEELYFWLLSVRDKMMEEYGSCPTCNGTGQAPDDGTGNNPGDSEEDDEEGAGNGSKPCPTCGGKHKGMGSDLFDMLWGSGIDTHIINKSDELAESTIREVIEAGKARGYGEISSDGKEQLRKLTEPAPIPWRTLLRRQISSYTHDYGNLIESSWKRRNRRMLPLPGIKRLNNRLTIAIDTSGSISASEFEQFFAQIEKIVRDHSSLTIIQWDTEVKHTMDGYRKGDWKKVTVHGRGGTDVQCIFNWAEEHKRTRDMTIVFTDGCFNHEFDHKNMKIIWCLTERRATVPHGINIFCDIKVKNSK